MAKNAVPLPALRPLPPGTKALLPVYPQLHSFLCLSEGLQMLSGLYWPAQEELQEIAGDKELTQSK